MPSWILPRSLIKVTCYSRVTHFHSQLSHQMWCFMRWAATAEQHFYLSVFFFSSPFFPKQRKWQTCIAGKERKMNFLCCSRGKNHWHITWFFWSPSSVNSSFNAIFPFSLGIKFRWRDNSMWKIGVLWPCLRLPFPHVPLNLELQSLDCSSIHSPRSISLSGTDSAFPLSPQGAHSKRSPGFGNFLLPILQVTVTHYCYGTITFLYDGGISPICLVSADRETSAKWCTMSGKLFQAFS